MDAQDLRAKAVEAAAALFSIPDFRQTLVDGLPPQADQFKWLVTHLETYIQTGRWEHNQWGTNPREAMRLQGEKDAQPQG